MGVPPVPALSPQPELNRSLQALLEAALPLVRAAASPLGPRAIALLGSAAQGGVVAVREEAGWRLLSDLDLGLIVERPAPVAWRDELAAHLARELGPRLPALGLLGNPLDVGLFPLPFLARAPLTLELADLLARPRLLWGDREVLAVRPPTDAAPFEGLRLMANRCVETLLPVSGEVELDLRAPDPAPWSATPDPAGWARAHRWGKLLLDGVLALLTARGILEPGPRDRLLVLPRLLPDDTRRVAILTAAEAWQGWREAPHWPPPEIALGANTALAAEVLVAAGRAAGLDPWNGERRGHWRRLLAGEGGAVGERLRRWRRWVAHRPSAADRWAVWGCATAWATSAWPASLQSVALLAAWLDATGARPGGVELRRRLAGMLPLCEDRDLERWDPAWGRALQEGVAWVRAAVV